MESITFKDCQEQILNAINKITNSGVISDPKGFILIDGFTHIHLQNIVGPNIILGGQSTVPAVAIVAKSTGLVYTFALKVLIPDIKI
jgi:hypothetical protein